MPVERGVQVPVPDPGGPYTPGLKPWPNPEGGRVSEPDLKRAAATGSGEMGCEDFRSDARSSSGDAPPLAAMAAAAPEVEVGTEASVDNGVFVDEVEALVEEAELPKGVKAATGLEGTLPSEGNESRVALDRLCLLPIDDGASALAESILLLDDEEDAVDKGLPDNLRPSKLGRAERPRAGERRPSGEGARGSAFREDDEADVLLAELVTAR